MPREDSPWRGPIDEPAGPGAPVQREPLPRASDGDAFVEAMRAGDRESACRALERASARLRGYLRSRMGSSLGGESGVEGVVYASIFKALEGWRSFDPSRGNIGFWLWTIGRNVACDEVRRERARSRYEGASADGGAQVSDPRREERGSAIRECIERVRSPRLRELLRTDLDHGGRAPSRVLGRELGVRPNVALNLRWRAHRELAKILTRVFSNELL